MTDEEKIDNALKDINVVSATRGTEVDMLLATGERLLRNQQDRLVGEKASYEAERTNMLNAYAANLAKLERDTADRLHQLQQEHQHRVSGIERLITKLKAMREA
jgi:hypothetical protein